MVIWTTVILREIHGNGSEICGNTAVIGMAITEMVANTPILNSSAAALQVVTGIYWVGAGC